MKEIKIIDTPLKTKMVEINLENATNNEKIQKEDVKEALDLLYGTKVEIVSFKANISTPTLQEDIINDYIFKLNVNGKEEIALNFACCFLKYSDAKKLTDKNAEANVKECLKILRKDRYLKHPLYYNDYAAKLVEKFKHTQID